MSIQNIRLQFIEGSSCKEYRLSIEENGGKYDVLASWGRIGATLQTGAKASGVTLEEAYKAYDKILKEKTAKGYLSYSTSPSGIGSNVVRNIDQRDTGLYPQLLVAITEDEAESYILDDRYCAQDKYDGKRLTVKKNDSEVIAANRKGLSVGFPDAIANAVQLAHSFVVDGEAIKERLYAFDLLELDGTNLRPLSYRQRLISLHNLFEDTKETDTVVVAKTAFGATDKRKLMAELKAANKEGIVFKLLDAPWSAGRPEKGGPAIKCKFYKTATVIVTKINAKRSVAVGVMDGNDLIQVGNVTIGPNKEIPQVHARIEVRYLYAFKGGSLFQPTYLQDRSDEIDQSDCVVSQLVYKAEDEE